VVDRRFEQIDRRFEQVDRRLDSLEQHDVGIDMRLDRLEAHVEATAVETRRYVDVVAEGLRGDIASSPTVSRASTGWKSRFGTTSGAVRRGWPR
jgi:hypothetical protein